MPVACNPDKYRIVLVEDHPLVRREIKKIIERSPELRVVGQAGDGIEFLESLETCIPDLVVLDLSMPRLGGFEASRRVKASHPHIKVLILTMHKDQEYLNLALAAGVEGYLLKEEMEQELLPAIAALRCGGTYITKLLQQDPQENRGPQQADS